MYINDAFNISCNDCTLSNCVNSTYSSFLIVKQPSFVFVPVNVSGSWYEDTGLAVLYEAEKHLLVRGKRFVAMLVAGIAVVITLIATATTATIALVSTVQTADFVNALAYNVTHALQSQEN